MTKSTIGFIEDCIEYVIDDKYPTVLDDDKPDLYDDKREEAIREIIEYLEGTI